MTVKKIEACCFRNLKQVAITPSDGMNVLYGDNAHGKTNLLEGLWLMTGGKSFRGSKDADMVMFGQPKASVETTFVAGGREQTARIEIESRRKAILNGIAQPAANRLIGRFCAVIFSPDHLSLIKDGPEGRRRFIDAACCQLRPLYMKVISEYTRVLTQRNKLIKAIKSGEQPYDDMLLDAFDERLAQSGAQVRRYRLEYIDMLAQAACDLYAQLAKGREQLSVTYDTAADGDRLFEEIKKTRAVDMKTGFTTVGPHRDDIDVTIAGTSARLFGSQGQQRSGVLAMKLAEASLLAKGYGENPVILLDDVMSELDRSRQEYILNRIDGFQVFITCCEPSAVSGLVGGRVFAVKNGEIEERT